MSGIFFDSFFYFRRYLFREIFGMFSDCGISDQILRVICKKAYCEYTDQKQYRNLIDNPC